MAKENDFYQVSLKAILKNEKGEVLVLGGLAGGSYEGFYDLPGGRIDKNEFTVPLPVIMAREIKEEIGDIEFSLSEIPVAVGRHLLKPHISYESEDTHVLYLFYEARYISGEIKVSEEHNGFKWLSLEDVELEKYFKSGILEGMKMYLAKK
jgi:8-oxo-dGTP pyrophosphatase MutT (NUDIX family)